MYTCILAYITCNEKAKYGHFEVVSDDITNSVGREDEASRTKKIYIHIIYYFRQINRRIRYEINYFSRIPEIDIAQSRLAKRAGTFECKIKFSIQAPIRHIAVRANANYLAGIFFSVLFLIIMRQTAFRLKIHNNGRRLRIRYVRSRLAYVRSVCMNVCVENFWKPTVRTIHTYIRSHIERTAYIRNKGFYMQKYTRPNGKG